MIAFCETCNVQVAARVVATHSELKPEALDPDECTPCRGFLYSMCLCEKCESVFLFQTEYYEVEGISSQMGESLLYPPLDKTPLENLPVSIDRAYRTALKSFRAGLYEPCVIMCRKCLDGFCQEFGLPKGNLYDRLQALEAQGRIDKKLLKWAHELRLLGNDGAHDVSVEITQADARDALEFTEAILMCTFSLNRRFEEFQQRRGKAD